MQQGVNHLFMEAFTGAMKYNHSTVYIANTYNYMINIMCLIGRGIKVI